MILYTNLKNVSVDSNVYSVIPVLKLTSSKLTNNIFQSDFETNPELNKRQKEILKKLFDEADENNFQIIIEKAD